MCVSMCVSLAVPICLFCSIGSVSFPLLCVSSVHIRPPLSHSSSSIPGINSPCVTALPNLLFWSFLMVFHQDLFQFVGSNWGHDCMWLYCVGWDTIQNKTWACVSLPLPSSGAVNLKLRSASFSSFLQFLFLIKLEKYTLLSATAILVICHHDSV